MIDFCPDCGRIKDERVPIEHRCICDQQVYIRIFAEGQDGKVRTIYDIPAHANLDNYPRN
jgi:hypothetical protein